MSLGSFKYAFKYINKCADKISIGINRLDGITQWVTGRYISASEAVWRILHFPTHKLQPNVVRLQVHLPGQHMTTFRRNEHARQVLARTANQRTLLLAFFKKNQEMKDSGRSWRMCTYQEFPQYFVWTQKSGVSERADLPLGACTYFVPPTGGERFYLRTLLAVVKGSTSYEDLRTYNERVYDTFEDACRARGLLEDDGEWRLCRRPRRSRQEIDSETYL